MLPEASKEITGELAADAYLGRLAGEYRLVQRVGEGGMGAVYRAVREGDPSGPPVAIKLIKRGMDTGSVLRRFHNERHILAALNHPNIARLLDAGTTADGLPYVVMEFIDGRPIVRYCDEHRLPLAARLEMFCKICAAVQCAHDKHVIHRDIKPSNILVTADGEPKLVDFGIAKVLDRDLLSLTSPEQPLTQMPVMTPQYASPEQARGETVTPASDIYSLGVLLYELLTGHRPYRVNARSAHEVIRAISEQLPERPSTAIMRSDTTGEITPEVVSAARGETPDHLRRRLAGNLDAILLKALRKDPARRYASAAEFSEDVCCHLEKKPVKAPRTGLLYDAGPRRKFALAAALGVILLAVAGWLGFTLWRGQGLRVRPSVAVLGFENLSRQPSAEWLSTALTEMFSTELAAGGRLRSIPGERVSQVKLELALPNAPTLAPATLARVRRSLGADYVVLGSYLAMGEGGAMQVRLDLRLQDTAAGDVIAAVTETRSGLALLDLVTRSGAALRQKLGAGELAGTDAAALRGALPDNPEAARAYSEGLEKLRRLDTLAARELLKKAVEAAPQHALSHSALALASGMLGYDPEARAEAKKALDLSANLAREDRLLIEGRYHESVRDWDRAVEIYRSLHTAYPDHLEYGLRLAAAQSHAGQGRRAVETIQLLRKLPGAAQDPRLDVAEAEAAMSASDLGRARESAARAAATGASQGLRILAAGARLTESTIFVQMGDPQRGLAAAREARRLYEAAGHRQGLAWAINEAGAVLTQLGDVAEARSNYEQALAICRTTGDQACIGIDLDSLGVLLRRQGDLRGALRMHEQALEVRRGVGDRGGMATALYNIGNVQETLGDLDAARAAEAESLDARRALGQKRTGALTMSRLADIRRLQGELTEALTMSKDAVAELRAIGDRGGTAMALCNLAMVLFDRGDLTGSRAAYEEALGVRRSQRDKNNTAQVLAGLAEVAIAQDRLPEARSELAESISLREALGEKIALAQSRLTLAVLSVEEGNPVEAERLARLAAAEFQRAGTAGLQAEAGMVLGRAQLARGNANGARQSLEAARRLLRGSKDCRLLLTAQLLAAQVDLAQARGATAVRQAERALSEAGRYGLPGGELEARLLLARLGRAQFAQVAADATQAGYKLIARKAAPADKR